MLKLNIKLLINPPSKKKLTMAHLSPSVDMGIDAPGEVPWYEAQQRLHGGCRAKRPAYVALLYI